MDPITARTLCQKHGDRYVIINPPPAVSEPKDLDRLHDLEFERDVHPFDRQKGSVRALDTIRFSIPTHYGCYGECHFCAISVHQGRTIQQRSEASIVQEARIISQLDGFKGYITDLGGPTANMYGFECKKKLSHGACADKRCLFPDICKSLKPDHGAYIRMIRKIEALPGIKKVFISSGIRHDLILEDKKAGAAFLKKILADNISGQMKVAPEHCQAGVLKHMGKIGNKRLLEFKKHFDALNKKLGKKQFLTYYLMAAHPGCTLRDMQALREFAEKKLHLIPEQVQIFTPSPSTWSTLMYFTGKDPFSDEPVFVEKDPQGKQKQKQIMARRQQQPPKSSFKRNKRK